MDGIANANELTICFATRILFYQRVDLLFDNTHGQPIKVVILRNCCLAKKKQSSAFPFLKEVIKAHVDRFPKEGRKEDLKRLLKISF
jgi:hypothetical protein